MTSCIRKCSSSFPQKLKTRYYIGTVFGTVIGSKKGEGWSIKVHQWMWTIILIEENKYDGREGRRQLNKSPGVTKEEEVSVDGG